MAGICFKLDTFDKKKSKKESDVTSYPAIDLICLKLVTQGFLGSLITNLELDFENSKWRIQNGGSNMADDFVMILDLLETCYSVVFGVADYESGIRF